MATDSALKVPLNHYIFFNLIILMTVQSSLSSGCIKIERESLLNFKGGLKDPGSVLSSWTGSDCCAWYGVSCDNRTGHVVRLDLHNQHDSYLDSGNYALGGDIRPSLLGLEQLTHLDLSLNSFNMLYIPQFIGSLNRLRYLNLSKMGFGGTIPPQIGNITGLQFLDLNSNIGMVVDDIGWLSHVSSLEFLDLSWINLKSVINWAQVTGSLPSLSVLHLDYCDLRGIPPLLNANFTSLTELTLGANKLRATPDWLFYINGLVTLDLGVNQIEGIPQTIGNLHNLQKLDFSFNFIVGEIPATIWNLTSLVDLDLSNNNFSGEISPSIGNLQNLQSLDLSSNKISGEIPSSIRNLRYLQELNFHSNNISGSIDALLECDGVCSEAMNTKKNNLNGSESASVKKIVSPLVSLEVSNNKLSGSIPESMGQHSKLVYLDLSSNDFEGVMSEAHFANLTKLDHLDLTDNLITLKVSAEWKPPFQATDIIISSCGLGPEFPTWLYNQTKFEYLDISNNGISDVVPRWLWNLSSSVKHMDMSGNQMRGNLPQDAFEFFPSNFQLLDLTSNKFDGPLPRLSNTMSYLSLSNNSFSGPIVVNISVSTWRGSFILSHNLINGTIPSSICNGSLGVIDLSYNHLSGDLHDCQPSLTLEVINFSNNNLSGVIPHSLSSKNLKSLHLSNNHLSGEIPSSLKIYTELAVLDLGENELSGLIPMWLGQCLSSLKVLRLRSNKFSGQVPPQLSQLASLQVLDLAHNNFSGAIPSLLGNFLSMASTKKVNDILYIEQSASAYYQENLMLFAKGEGLEYTNTLSLVTSIDLSSNDLSGDIPAQLMTLFGLRFLNLSTNKLTGVIPQNIGGLSQLESLDLSVNQLSGEIPISMSTLTSLAYLNLSYNELSGRIPIGNQLQTLTDPSIYIGNPKLCGNPLPMCPRDEASTPRSGGEADDESEMIWFYIGFAPGLAAGFWGIMGVLFLKRSWRLSLFRFFDEIWDWVYVAVSVKLASWRDYRARAATT